MVTLVAQRLQVYPIKKMLIATYRIWDDMVHACGSFDYPFLLTQFAQRMFDAEGPREPRPAGCMVQIRRALPTIRPVMGIHPILRIPGKPCRHASTEFRQDLNRFLNGEVRRLVEQSGLGVDVTGDVIDGPDGNVQITGDRAFGNVPRMRRGLEALCQRNRHVPGQGDVVGILALEGLDKPEPDLPACANLCFHILFV